MKPVFLDSPSTTRPDHRVIEAMVPFLQDEFGNPHSNHVHGIKSAEAVDLALSQIAKLINANPGEIVFTSGATEANNSALKGVMKSPHRRGNHMVISAIEHMCVLNAAQALQMDGVEVTIVPPDATGVVSTDDIASAIRPDTALVSLMLLNNEVGTLQPVRETAALVRSKGAVMHTDAAQFVGKHKIDVEDLGVDLLSLSGHKFYGPKGIGAHFISRQSPVAPLPLIHGGGQQAGRRGGTLPTFLCVGLGTAAEIAFSEQAQWLRSAQSAARIFENTLKRLVPDFQRNGNPRQGTTCVNYRFPGVDAEAVLQQLFGRVSASLGSACSVGTIAPSHVLTAMGYTSVEAFECIRFGFDKDIRAEEARVGAELVAEAVANIRAVPAA